MDLIIVIVVAACFVMTAFHYWRRFCDETFTIEELRLFLRWSGTGLLLPLACWFFFNMGIVGPPVWPSIAPVSAGAAGWWNSFHQPLAAGWFLISSYWAGVTFIWLLCRAIGCFEERKTIFRDLAAWSMLIVPAALFIVVAGGWPAVGMAMMLGGLGALHATLAIRPEKPLPPSYARALARISFGKYEQAEIEVIRELEQCEEDFDGWMMLAELYATHFNDLTTADQTIRDLCEQPTTSATQISIALNRLADWHLKLAHDPVAARRVLEMICSRTPGTHLEKMARQRINRLPATRAELLEQEQGKPLHLPTVPDETDAPALVLPDDQAVAVANECVRALERNPDDIVSREKFARVLAESLNDVNTAIDQLELLLTMPKQPANKRAEWLVTIAGWQARYRNDLETARLIFAEVVRDFPDTPQAFAAQRRINLLSLQAQSRSRRHSA